MQINIYKLLAQTTGGTPGTPINLPNPLGVTSFADLIDRIVNYLIILSAPIVAGMIIWGAFQILNAVGNPEKAIEGRRTITYAVIGYAIILISKGITLIVQQILGG